MNSSLVTLSVVLGGLGVSGGLSHRLMVPGWEELRGRQPAGRMIPLERSPGPLVSLGRLGGFRALVADLLWLRVNVLWEERHLVRTLRTLHLVTAADPRPLVFWLNGARMMAYDMPAWRVAALGGDELVPAGIRLRIEGEQAQLALAWLDQALEFHPASPAIFIEQANICLNRLHDLKAAAASYRRAAEQPDSPCYAARLHGELLRRLGRREEALAWLVQLHPRLPRDDEEAAAGLVLARIRDLETELAVPPERRYPPGR